MQVMQRFINAFCRREYSSKSESSPGEGSPAVAGDDNDNHLDFLMTDITSQKILRRLGRCATENPHAYSEERDIPLIRQTETWDCGECNLMCISRSATSLTQHKHDVGPHVHRSFENQDWHACK